MSKALSTSVLIIGAGPVGMTLALDLAWRGIDSIVVEQRPADERPRPRANHISARAMETYRRLGIAGDLRRTGLPADFPTDVVWMTTMTGYELTRIPLPSRNELGRPGYADSNWPTPEPQHKINQMYIEPILRKHGARNAAITPIYSARFDRFRRNADAVVSEIVNLEDGSTLQIDAAYLIGCDGGVSTIRKAIGARFEGDAALTRVVSLHLKAPALLERLPGKPAHRYWLVNPAQAGGAVCLNGSDIWSIHVMLPTPHSDPAKLDRDRAIRAITGLDDLDYELFAEDAWTGRRLLAEFFSQDRVFVCGDAAHIWVPNAGYGMNAGIADAENLAWRLAAVLQGWGGPALLEGYEKERRPITDQASRIAKDLAIRNRADEFRRPPPEMMDSGAAGEKARKRFGQALRELNLPQFAPAGLNFAYFYDASPDIAYDGETAPPYSLGEYQPATVPGCRTPHFFCHDGSSIYDRMGPGYTLLRRNTTIEPAALLDAARELAVPVEVCDVDPDETGAVYRHELLLSRPDRHVAWRGNSVPADPAALIRLISGR